AAQGRDDSDRTMGQRLQSVAGPGREVRGCAVKGFVRICQFTLLALVFLWIAPTCFISTVPMGKIGVRSSNMSGVLEDDLEPGWTLDVAGVHALTLLPSHYLFLDYGTDDGQGLQIRTRDNNNVFVDVSVPYRIRPGEAHMIM